MLWLLHPDVEGRSSCFAVGEVLAGVADAIPSFCCLNQYCCSFLLEIFLYRLCIALQARTLIVSRLRLVWLPGISSKVSRDRRFCGGRGTLCCLSAVVEVLNQPLVFLVDVVYGGIFPGTSESFEVIPIDNHLGGTLLEFCGSLSH